MKKTIYLLLAAIFLAGCAFPGASGQRIQPAAPLQATADVPTSTPIPALPTATSTPMPASPTETMEPTPTLVPTLQAFPFVTFTQDTNCRRGPGKSYFADLTFKKGDTTQANARNEDGAWISVQVPNKSNYCWVSASLLEGLGDVQGLLYLEAQTLPQAPWEISILKEICGEPNIVLIEWSPVVDATGYRIYRNGELVSTNYSGDNRFYDNPRVTIDYTYAIEAFNEYGVSPRLAIKINACD